MAQRLFLVKNSSPLAGWYKVFASGDHDPDIHAGYLLEQFRLYSKTDVTIVHTVDCTDSNWAANRFVELAKEALAGDIHVHGIRSFDDAKDKNWFRIPVEKLRELMAEAIKK